MKKVIKLNESDIENLVKRIIKEDENQGGEPTINIKDVQHFMEVMLSLKQLKVNLMLVII